MNYFVLEDQFQRFLEMTGLKVNGQIDIPVHVINSMRMAFVGGVGMTMDYQAIEYKGKTIEELTAIVTDLGKQVTAYWEQQKLNIQANRN